MKSHSITNDANIGNNQGRPATRSITTAQPNITSSDICPFDYPSVSPFNQPDVCPTAPLSPLQTHEVNISTLVYRADVHGRYICEHN